MFDLQQDKHATEKLSKTMEMAGALSAAGKHEDAARILAPYADILFDGKVPKEFRVEGNKLVTKLEDGRVLITDAKLGTSHYATADGEVVKAPKPGETVKFTAAKIKLINDKLAGIKSAINLQLGSLFGGEKIGMMSLNESDPLGSFGLIGQAIKKSPFQEAKEFMLKGSAGLDLNDPVTLEKWKTANKIVPDLEAQIEQITSELRGEIGSKKPTLDTTGAIEKQMSGGSLEGGKGVAAGPPKSVEDVPSNLPTISDDVIKSRYKISDEDMANKTKAKGIRAFYSVVDYYYIKLGRDEFEANRDMIMKVAEAHAMKLMGVLK